MLHIKSVTPVKDKILQIEFEEYPGQYKVDMKEYIGSKTFDLAKQLNDEMVFQSFTIENGVICWSNGYDIAPEYLFFLANKNNPQYHQQFIEWGYVK